MQASDISWLTTQVLWAAFFLSVIFGAVAQRTHFCTMGAVSDVVNMGDWTRMRQWGLAIGVAMIGFAALAYGGLIDPAKTLYSSNRWLWLSAAVGGALFGFGMVLASGCGSKTLVRVGGGSLKSLIVFVVMGLAAFATLKGITAVLRVATVDQVAVDLSAGVSLSQWAAAALGVKPLLAGLLLGVLLGGSLVLWSLLSTATDRSTGVICDQLIAMNGYYVAQDYPEHLRRIRFKDLETGKNLIFLTNNTTLPTLTIAALYKNRWQVELFFKWIKQHLRIKKFLGTSQNAVKTQIWCAVCTYVLIAIVKKELHLDASLYTLLQILSVSVFEKTEISCALQPDANISKISPSANQLNLFTF